MKPSLILAISLFAVSLSGQAAALSLKSCAVIENPVERLACYDTLAGRLPADTAKESGTALSAVDPVAPKADVMVPDTPAVTPTLPPVEPTEAIFGLEHTVKPEEDRPGELQLKWDKKKKDAYGKWIIILENGQVWRQTDSTRFSFKNSEQWVVVSRGMMGAYFMGEPNDNKRIRVKRVK